MTHSISSPRGLGLSPESFEHGLLTDPFGLSTFSFPIPTSIKNNQHPIQSNLSTSIRTSPEGSLTFKSEYEFRKVSDVLRSSELKSLEQTEINSPSNHSINQNRNSFDTHQTEDLRASLDVYDDQWNEAQKQLNSFRFGIINDNNNNNSLNNQFSHLTNNTLPTELEQAINSADHSAYSSSDYSFPSDNDDDDQDKMTPIRVPTFQLQTKENSQGVSIPTNPDLKSSASRCKPRRSISISRSTMNSNDKLIPPLPDLIIPNSLTTTKKIKNKIGIVESHSNNKEKLKKTKSSRSLKKNPVEFTKETKNLSNKSLVNKLSLGNLLSKNKSQPNFFTNNYNLSPNHKLSHVVRKHLESSTQANRADDKELEFLSKPSIDYQQAKTERTLTGTPKNPDSLRFETNPDSIIKNLPSESTRSKKSINLNKQRSTSRKAKPNLREKASVPESLDQLVTLRPALPTRNSLSSVTTTSPTSPISKSRKTAIRSGSVSPPLDHQNSPPIEPRSILNKTFKSTPASDQSILVRSHNDSSLEIESNKHMPGLAIDLPTPVIDFHENTKNNNPNHNRIGHYRKSTDSKTLPALSSSTRKTGGGGGGNILFWRRKKKEKNDSLSSQSSMNSHHSEQIGKISSPIGIRLMSDEEIQDLLGKPNLRRREDDNNTFPEKQTIISPSY
ncbi:hypothetical protein CROQUDRAFT_135561 [Cronartium quercuum f. sp. fusiforme G11]|uniref:Uncharacterized protein n=1 Tax=Cronartium quercuum f. sp. fusiforme G11 TaxID=708437 RepID=A0A9P6NAM6_9BASI|nr:hypothetical protein CROQUDRAFT_135561 [Cronartium quercuum f. sp. fusiforme G11]